MLPQIWWKLQKKWLFWIWKNIWRKTKCLNEKYKRNRLNEKRRINSVFYHFIIQYLLYTFFFSIKIKSSSTSSTIILTINQTGKHRIYFEGEPDISGVNVDNVNNPPDKIYVNNALRGKNCF